MAEESYIISLVIKGKDQASSMLQGFGGALKTVGGLALGLGTAVIGGAAVVGGAIAKLAIDAAPVVGVQAAFEGLAESAGVGMDEMLGALQRGSSGMIANRDLMTSFNKAAQLVSIDFAQVLPDAMGALGKVSAATGEDMGFLLDSLVTGVGRLSPMILDNLGIQVSLAEASAAWAAENGVLVTEMTKTQQQTALMDQVMVKLNENTASMPEVTGTATASMAGFQATIQNLKDDIGAAFVPALNEVVGVFGEIIQDVGPDIIKWAGVAAEWLGKRLPGFIRSFKTIFWTSFRIARKAVADAWVVIEPVFALLQTWFAVEGPGALETLKKGWNDVWNFILDLTDIAVQWFTENLPLIIAAGEQIIDVWNNNIVPAFDNIWVIIKTIVSTALEVVLGFITVGMALITGDWETAWEGIKDILSTIWEGLKTVVTEGAQAILDLIVGENSLLDDLKSNWSSVWSNLKTIVLTSLNAIPGIVSTALNDAKNTVLGKIDSFKDAGAALIQGIKDGMSSMLESLISTALGIAESVVAAIRDFLGMDSPSKLFNDIGVNVMGSWAQGMLRSSVMPISAASQVAGQVSAATQANNTQTVTMFGPRFEGVDSAQTMMDDLSMMTSGIA